ncbi:NAD(P)-binding domain-containing protein [Streptomyces aurantiacus]|uniref:Putative oxidoreductase GLYR1 like protein n=1 Tax=Streptomyces aurantiacus JA 4570 TaxID=1286094 RepID=S3ZG23_9ACTN|nr:NAD(P)-binding domain-containing protein [Streptomyces aurantiacus]AUD39529.1 WHU imine reductase 45 [synthetic construct]EPH42606.1 putative oxidoreductase GLYR1 like protein [Streptomyces aurantiacus JA 4570]
MATTTNSTNPTTASTLTPVTVIGLGAMGQALAGAFLKAGHPTTIWNRSPGKGEDLVARGATRAATPAEAVRAGEVVVVCVVDYEASQSILEPIAADLAGRVLVNVTSDAPERAREAGEWAAEHDIAYLDGAVMIPTVMIGTPDALLFYSGDKAAYDKHEGLLKSLGGQSAYVGADHGLAAVYDLSMLDFFWTSMSGLVHGYALAAKDGVPAASIAPFLKSHISLLSLLVEETAKNLDEGAYPGAEANLAMEVEGIEHILHAAERRGLDVSVLRGVRDVAQRAVDLGHGADSWSATVEGARNPA